ncbi:LysR family transcriptional regulator [Haematobacter genomosp. 1]|uniref:LysR family transcriptional regulator n=1 Tax=Haematobacter genomosp. 1 TaxID=366618 RepID=A0A212AE58_9RHOB|nr:LysR substrate-binding domain-containing protein [Haematobacter genomosp. 1]OWJ79494.1 LysR family transcriptional regulator [Haematobacter genomosp. 1]
MEINQLITLVHVAELGSISKAADRLNIVQPALSRQIRLLEEELGVPLFERHGRGVAITPAGQAAVDHALRVLAEIDSLRGAVEEGRSSFRGLVRIGATPTVAELMTVPLMVQIKNDHPELAVRFSSAFAGYLVDWMARGELDVMISYDPASTRSLRVRPVLMESLFLIGPSGALCEDRPVRFRDLALQPLVLPSPRHGLRAIFDHCARVAGITFTQVIEADSFASMIDLTRAGFGATILPVAPIHRSLAAGELSCAPLVDPAPERKLVLCYSADRPVSPAARYVGELFIRLTQERVESGIWKGTLL